MRPNLAWDNAADAFGIAVMLFQDSAILDAARFSREEIECAFPLRLYGSGEWWICEGVNPVTSAVLGCARSQRRARDRSYRRRGGIGRQLSPICHVLLGISSRGTGAV